MDDGFLMAAGLRPASGILTFLLVTVMAGPALGQAMEGMSMPMDRDAAGSARQRTKSAGRGRSLENRARTKSTQRVPCAALAR